MIGALWWYDANMLIIMCMIDRTYNLEAEVLLKFLHLLPRYYGYASSLSVRDIADANEPPPRPPLKRMSYAHTSKKIIYFW